MLQYHVVPVTPFAQNCSLVWCDQTQSAAVIDPGGDLDRVLAKAQRRSAKVIFRARSNKDEVAALGARARRVEERP